MFAAVVIVFPGKEGMLEMGVQMGRGYKSALQSHLCLILVSILLMGKVSLWNQEEMVQFHMRVSGGAGLEPVPWGGADLCWGAGTTALWQESTR